MDDPVLVRSLQSVGNLARDRERVFHWYAAGPHLHRRVRGPTPGRSRSRVALARAQGCHGLSRLAQAPRGGLPQRSAFRTTRPSNHLRQRRPFHQFEYERTDTIRFFQAITPPLRGSRAGGPGMAAGASFHRPNQPKDFVGAEAGPRDKRHRS
jgi:hypothetical protein